MVGDSAHARARVPGTGAEVLIDADGTGLVRTADGRFLRLRSVPPGLPDILRGTRDGGDDVAAYARRLREELLSREEAHAQARWPAARRRVVLLGRGTVVEDLAEALREWGVTPVRHADAAALLAACHVESVPWDVVIGYADSPAERAGWDRLDDLPGRGTTWVRAYREGEVCFVDPVASRGEDPGSEQVRRRRLAASPVPREFEAWQNAAAESGPLPWTARSLLVSRVLAVLLAWAHGPDTVRSYRTTLWKFVPATATISEHPILAYPPPAVAVQPGAVRS
ncbi:hypothetical protein B1813_02535 [Saccharomonospora piscinae]|uniref:Uncharacterized protein n=1 Tax=Saccharomonospora piscinae TaxID=687388 RepID=A0A1V9ACV9_SACPI|nr:hypothetical protein [Saccharomonospora piscinae]OQO94962.1 hypothetical protein B1813_02535 [Saccharomonospora piscinae]